MPPSGKWKVESGEGVVLVRGVEVWKVKLTRIGSASDVAGHFDQQAFAGGRSNNTRTSPCNSISSLHVHVHALDVFIVFTWSVHVIATIRSHFRELFEPPSLRIFGPSSQMKRVQLDALGRRSYSREATKTKSEP